MNCPYCNHIDTKVTDSRDTGGSIRRRRECLSCNKRFTTYEYIEMAPLFVIKKDGRQNDSTAAKSETEWKKRLRNVRSPMKKSKK